MKIQPVGWKSNQQQNSEKLKVLDFDHATSILPWKALTIYFGIVWLIWPCLKGNHLSLSNIKTGFNHSLDGFPTIKISQKMEKANL